MPSVLTKESFYEFPDGKIPKIHYLLAEGLIEFKTNDNENYWFENHTELNFDVTENNNLWNIHLKESDETIEINIKK